jgi:hypothetical protein
MTDPTALAQLERLAVDASKAAARALEGAVEMRIDAHTADVEQAFLLLNQIRQGIVRLLDVPPVVHEVPPIGYTPVSPVHTSASASLSAVEADWDLSESTAPPPPPPNQPFQCPLCDKSYAKRHVLANHVNLRHPPKVPTPRAAPRQRQQQCVIKSKQQIRLDSEHRRNAYNDKLRLRARDFFVVHEKEKDGLQANLVTAAGITLSILLRWLCYPNVTGTYQERGTRRLMIPGALTKLEAWLDEKEAM